MTDHHYLLHDDHTIEAISIKEWLSSDESCRAEQRNNKSVALTTDGNVEVSTIFLQVDHNYKQGGPPILFETMVFCGDNAISTVRCSTYDQAVAQHKRIVRELCLCCVRHRVGGPDNEPCEGIAA